MFEKIKKWCEHEFKSVKYGFEINDAVTRCYGAIMFVINSLIDYDSEETKQIIEWWDNEMHPRFRELYFTIDK